MNDQKKRNETVVKKNRKKMVGLGDCEGKNEVVGRIGLRKGCKKRLKLLLAKT